VSDFRSHVAFPDDVFSQRAKSFPAPKRISNFLVSRHGQLLASRDTRSCEPNFARDRSSRSSAMPIINFRAIAARAPASGAHASYPLRTMKVANCASAFRRILLLPAAVVRDCAIASPAFLKQSPTNSGWHFWRASNRRENLCARRRPTTSSKVAMVTSKCIATRSGSSRPATKTQPESIPDLGAKTP
jgi:hypothetical protein